MSTNKRARKWYPFIYRVIYRVFTSTFGWGTHLVFGHRSRWLENRFYALVVCVCVCLFQDCQQSPLFVFCFYFVSLLFDAPTRPARDRSGRNESDRLTRSGLDARQDWTTISTEISRSQHKLNALHFVSHSLCCCTSPAALPCSVQFCSVLFLGRVEWNVWIDRGDAFVRSRLAQTSDWFTSSRTGYVYGEHNTQRTHSDRIQIKQWYTEKK